jgi:hypothetical protein
MFWLMIPLIDVLFSVFFLSFLSGADPGIESVESWLHSRSFLCIVFHRPELVKVDQSFLMSRSTWDIALEHIA